MGTERVKEEVGADTRINVRLSKKAKGNGDPMQSVNYQISLYPRHENKKIERRVRKRHQKIS